MYSCVCFPFYLIFSIVSRLELNNDVIRRYEIVDETRKVLYLAEQLPITGLILRQNSLYEHDILYSSCAMHSVHTYVEDVGIKFTELILLVFTENSGAFRFSIYGRTKEVSS